MVHPVENGDTLPIKDIGNTFVEDAETFVKQICRKVQCFVGQENPRNDTSLKMLSQCIQYFSSQIYVNNEVYKNQNYEIFLTRLLQLYKRTRACFIKETIRGGDSRRILQDLRNWEIDK